MSDLVRPDHLPKYFNLIDAAMTAIFIAILASFCVLASLVGYTYGHADGYQNGLKVGKNTVSNDCQKPAAPSQTLGGKDARTPNYSPLSALTVERDVIGFTIKDIETGTTMDRHSFDRPTWVERATRMDGRSHLRWLEGLLGQGMDLEPGWTVIYITSDPR